MSDDENTNSPQSEQLLSSSPEKKPVKLPYFHRKLSAEDEALIGDTTPKQIHTPGSSENTSIKESTSTKITEGSAWNSANTWEERDTTSWAKSKLIEIFSNSSTAVSAASNKVKIMKIEKVEGNSSVTHVRGRARFLYEWSFSLDFEVTSGLLGNFKGTAAIADVINDQLNDIEIEIKWDSPKPTVLDGRNLQNSLKEEVIRRVRLFEEEYKNISK